MINSSTGVEKIRLCDLIIFCCIFKSNEGIKIEKEQKYTFVKTFKCGNNSMFSEDRMAEIKKNYY